MSKSELLLAGWHQLWDENGTRWVHPKFDIKLSYHQAIKVLRKRGTDQWGEMN